MAATTSGETPPLVLGTAGHIDHGKTALISALTGKNTDRLPDERSRGIPIQLGFDAGVVAITKADLADPSLAWEEVAELVPSATPIVPVSAVSRTGIDDL